MKYLLTLVLITAALATNAAAEQLEYDLKVNGMVCAFCAYSVSKQLRTLDGVVPDTIDVDLEQGRVRLLSGSELDRDQLTDLLLTAGFTLRSVNESSVPNAEPGRHRDSVILSMTIDADRLSDGQFDAVLEAIGAVAVQRSGRISVVGPAELELAILKPVLMGRQVVINVDYDPADRPDRTIAVSVLGNPESAR